MYTRPWKQIGNSGCWAIGGETGEYGGMTRLLALLLIESLHKRIAMVSSRQIIPLADWARLADVRGNVAANKAKRQMIPAFRLRDRWVIAEDYR